jgi:cytoskeleton protein RodZ
MSETMSAVVENELTEEAVLAVLPAVGEQLRAARKARLLEVADVAQALKLGPRQVEALENGDWDGLPGATFVRGFVRNYARLVQIDSGPLMAQLDSVLQKPANTLAVTETKTASMPSGVRFGPPRRDRAVVIFGLLLVVAAALAYFLLAKDLSSLRETAQTAIDSLARKADSEPPAPKAAEVPAESAPIVPAVAPGEPVFPPGATPQQVMNPQVLVPPEQLAPATMPVVSGVTAEKSKPAAGEAQLRFVVDKESWVEVRDRDNKVVFSERFVQGADKAVSGQGPLTLVIGYAPGVKLYWRGELIDLVPHAKGDVARLVLE